MIGFLNRLHIDHVVAEIASRDESELAHFKDLRPEIGLGLGVIDIKRTVVEKPEQIAKAIEHADKILGIGRVKYVHPDCGFWMLKRSIADAKMGGIGEGAESFSWGLSLKRRKQAMPRSSRLSGVRSQPSRSSRRRHQQRTLQPASESSFVPNAQAWAD